MSAGFSSDEDVTEDMGRVLKTIQEMSLSCIEKPSSFNLWSELGRILERGNTKWVQLARNVDGITDSRW